MIELTGAKAWSLIAPLIAHHQHGKTVNKHYELDAPDDAYIVTFKALQEYDEKRKQEGKNGKTDKQI